MNTMIHLSIYIIIFLKLPFYIAHSLYLICETELRGLVRTWNSKPEL